MRKTKSTFAAVGLGKSMPTQLFWKSTREYLQKIKRIKKENHRIPGNSINNLVN
jgi:hypothetical protein